MIKSIQALPRARLKNATVLLTSRQTMKTDTFVQGVAYAVAELNRTHDQPAICLDILNNSGIQPNEFELHAADYDLNELRKIWPALNGRDSQ